jgi:hypothetical protein
MNPQGFRKGDACRSGFGRPDDDVMTQRVRRASYVSGLRTVVFRYDAVLLRDAAWPGADVG